ncbi:valine--tRNA ligase, chloroplastic/mitochondrial 2 isoform X1 [Tanacetum coccineum]
MITMIYLFAKKLDLPILTVMNKDGILNEVAGLYNGLDRFEARKKLSTELEETGLAVRKKLTHQEFLDLNVNLVELFYLHFVALQNEFVILQLQPLQESRIHHVTCANLREITDDAKAFATGNRALAALFVHTPVGYKFLELGKVCKEVGLLNGVVNILSRLRSGCRLHILDAALSTTVSKIMIAAAQYVDSELGGKSPIVVFDDVDIDKARVYTIWLLLDQRPKLQCNISSHTTYVSGLGGNYTNTYGLVVYGVSRTSKKESAEKRKRSSKTQEEDNVEEGNERTGKSIYRVPKIKDNYNPATWLLEVSSSSGEVALGVDFAQIYSTSAFYHVMKLTINIRLGSGSNSPEKKETQDFADWILNTGTVKEQSFSELPSSVQPESKKKTQLFSKAVLSE